MEFNEFESNPEIKEENQKEGKDEVESFHEEESNHTSGNNNALSNNLQSPQNTSPPATATSADNALNQHKLKVFSHNSIQTNGIVLYRYDPTDIAKPANAGVVYFSLEEIPLGQSFLTETGVSIERTGDDQFKLLGEPIDLAQLLEQAEQHEQQAQKLIQEQQLKKAMMAKEAQGIRTFDEFPDDIKKILKKSHIEKEEVMRSPRNFELLLNILRYTEHRDFRSLEMKQRQLVVKSIPVLENPVTAEIIKRAESLITVDDKAKKYFKSTELAGKGGFGRVFFAEQIHPTKAPVAIKKMPHTTDKERIANYLEIGFLHSCIHPNIVRYMHSYKIKEEIWIVTEYMAGGTLNNAVESYSFTEAHIAYIAREILKAIQFMHYKDYIHRDLKSSNIMLTFRAEVKLIDLGLCEDVSKGPIQSMSGSAMWMSPEVILNKPYSYPTDIWSFGICMLEILNGGPPNYGGRIKTMYHIATEGTGLLHPEKWSPELRNFVSQCLEMSPDDRATAEDLLDHPFLKKAEARKNMREVIRTIFLNNALSGMF